MIIDNWLDKIQLKMDMLGADSIKKFLLENGSDKIGKCVRRGMEIPEKWMLAATSVCRRRFHWLDIIWMIALDDAEEGEAGIVFTKKGIYHWLEEENFVAEVLYDDIVSVEYNKNHVILTLDGGMEIKLLCDKGTGEEMYNRHLYNFIVDIVEFIKEGKSSPDI